MSGVSLLATFKSTVTPCAADPGIILTGRALVLPESLRDVSSNPHCLTTMVLLPACPHLDAFSGIIAAGIVSSPVSCHIIVSNMSLYLCVVRSLHLQENRNAWTNVIYPFDLRLTSNPDEILSPSRGWSVECKCDCIWDFLDVTFGVYMRLPPFTLASSGKIPRPNLVQVEQISFGLSVRPRKAACSLSDIA